MPLEPRIKKSRTLLTNPMYSLNSSVEKMSAIPIKRAKIWMVST